MLKGKLPIVCTVPLLAVFLLMGIACQNVARKPEVERNKELAERYKEEPTISLYVAETGKTKEIKLEEYIKGVVATEMDPTWPERALAAQAILARTFTLKKIEEGGVEKRGTDASTDVEEFQAYDAARINDRVEKAVNMTRGEVVTYNGRLINGWFHADAGGQTAASAQEGLDYKDEKTPYIKSVKDPGFQITEPENKSWTAEFPLSEVRQKIKQQTGSDPGNIQGVKVISKGPSGRITRVQMGYTTISGNGLRLALGKDRMRSTLVEEMNVIDGRLVIRGRGYGHGVGMSQWGARKLAEDGRSPEEIVRYFFRNVKIQKIWD
ncbi:MAG: stage sporulation protein [Clostridia bacterium]|jgi:stage II sporulation protein D|nr:sporulation protein [Clostridiales bacterium]MDK2985334.1 stage sporulation protein [Clostridia bacterium]